MAKTSMPSAEGRASQDQMAPDRSAAPGYRTQDCARFEELFRRLQAETGQLVPPRKAFSLTAARTFLPYVSLFEILEPRLVLVRLVGTAIVSRTHIDNTGRNMLDLFAPEVREWNWSHFTRLLNTPCGCTLLTHEEYEHASVLIEIVSFPFADADNVPRYLASLSIEVDRQTLLLRGDQAMQLGHMHGYRYIDIGAGT